MALKKSVKQNSRLRDKNFFLHVEAMLSENVPQKLLGITEREFIKMFQEASIFLENHEINKAIAAFTLLCQLHPYISDCWYGLGRALRGNRKYKQALSAFFMAETVDPIQFDFYKEQIECCLLLEKKKEALHIFQRMKAHRKQIEDYEKNHAEISDLETIVNG